MTLPAGVAAAIVEHARRAAPEECCGLLLGTADAIVEAAAARNIAGDRLRRYTVDPRDHFDAIRRARTRALEVIGVYHSHPQTAPSPSPTDAAAAFEHFLFLIVSLRGEPELRAWRWLGGNFVATPLVRLP